MARLIDTKRFAAGLVCAAGVLCALAYGCTDAGETTAIFDKKKDASPPEPTPDTGGGDTGSDGGGDTGTGDSAPEAASLNAMATLASLAGDAGASGTAHFTETNGEVEVTLTVDGPPGLHGVHVHQTGDCGDAGQNAGGHFNPGTTGHGHPDASPHHAGDFGNLSLDDAGKGTLSIKTREITLAPDAATSVLNRALIVHANPDDGTAGVDGGGPGNSGARIGCGIIEPH